MKEYKVKEGDCLSSISQKHGFLWETLWNLPENAGLKQDREDQTILLPGDIVKIPELGDKQESCATEQRHRFRRLGVPSYLRLQIMRPLIEDDEDEQQDTQEPDDEPPLEVDVEDAAPQQALSEEPWSNAPYMLDIEGALTEGNTDEEGKIEVPIPPNARRVRLIMEPGTEQETIYNLELGMLDPVSSPSGIADRLKNLGYYDGARPQEITDELAHALSLFQQDNDLERSGQADQSTRDKLREVHGS